LLLPLALRNLGITEADLGGVVEKGAKASSVQAYPLSLTKEEVSILIRDLKLLTDCSGLSCGGSGSAGGGH
jgi:hypothetical protein